MTQLFWPFIGKFMVVYFDVYWFTIELKNNIWTIWGTFQAEKFYTNPKKCAFCTDRVILLGFMAHLREFSQILRRWGQLLCGHNPVIRKVRSFHRLATFYHQFIKNFNVIMTLITNCLKNEEFQWTLAATKAFKEVKKLLSEAHVCVSQIFQKYLK